MIQAGQAQSVSNVGVQQGAAGREYDGLRHQTGGRVVPPSPLLVKVDQERVNNNSGAICGDMRTLCKAGRVKEAVHILNQGGLWADSNTYLSLLKECIKMKDLARGKKVHAHILQSGCKSNIMLLSTVVNMYAKCGSIVDARKVFDKMPERDLFTWTIMMAGYARHGHYEETLKMFEQMRLERVTPDRITFVCVLNVCASLGVLEKGKEVHAEIIKAGIGSQGIMEPTLVNMYARCGSMVDAHQVFDKMSERDLFTWTIMMAGYAKHGPIEEAFKIYDQMQRHGVTPDRVTFICVLNMCASLGALERGKQVHAAIIKAEIVPYINLETALVDMYAKCGSMKDAHQVFDNMTEQDVVSWSALIAGYAQHGDGRKALKIYEKMQLEGVMPNKVTFISVLNACASLGALEKGKDVHADIVKTGVASYVTLDNSLVDMYVKCGSVKDARQVFDNLAKRDVVSWNAMIIGYAQHGCGWEALSIYEQMQQEGVIPDRVTFTCVLNACATLGALEKGKEVHADIIKAVIASETILETALVGMYAKCGNMKNALQVFTNMAERDLVSWNTMIAGCAQHGYGREALQLFEEMLQEGLKPDSITFISLFSACSHVGLVDEGCHYFATMCRDHCLTPSKEHFGCMVDLLGRAGRLDEAEVLINKMPIEPDASVWGALLGACRIHGDVKLAEWAAKCILELDPQHPAAYVLLSNVYAAAGRWNDKAQVRKMMDGRGVGKEPGHSCIKVENQVHPFLLEEKLY